MDIMLQKSVIKAVTVTKKETTGGVQGELNNKKEEKSGSMKAYLTDVIKAGVMHEEALEEVTTMDYMDTNMQGGPHVPKAKSTWVRLNREAYWPGEKDSGQNKPVLRKRSATEIENRGSHKSFDAQFRKRGKLDTCDKDEAEISAGVEGHPCRKQ